MGSALRSFDQWKKEAYSVLKTVAIAHDEPVLELLASRALYLRLESLGIWLTQFARLCRARPDLIPEIRQAAPSPNEVEYWFGRGG